MEYAFHVYNKHAADGVSMAMNKLLENNLNKKLDSRKSPNKTEGTGMSSRALYVDPNASPVIVCVGSDLAIGDSLGPITGSMLKYKTQGLGVFIYGTLASPVTAKEIKYMRTFLKETHAGSPVVAIDAAVGAEGDIGLIKCLPTPLYPGAGANKKLGSIGDLSIMGIVAEKSVANYGLLNTTRLHLVYTMSEILSDAIANLLYNRQDSKTADCR